MPRPVGLALIFGYKVGFLPIVLAQIGRFWRFLGHLEGDLIPKRGHIFLGSWASPNDPNNIYKLGLLSLRGYFV
jgi:hypothetical protein